VKNGNKWLLNVSSSWLYRCTHPYACRTEKEPRQSGIIWGMRRMTSSAWLRTARLYYYYCC
jgi:hypothetical protein